MLRKKLLFFAVSEMIEEEEGVAYFNVVNNQHSPESGNEDHENIINIINVQVDIRTKHLRNISQKL
jgi:hypothetical protein